MFAPHPGAGVSGSHITPPPELVELVMAEVEELVEGPLVVVLVAASEVIVLGAPPVTPVEPTLGPGPLVVAPPEPAPPRLGCEPASPLGPPASPTSPRSEPRAQPNIRRRRAVDARRTMSSSISGSSRDEQSDT
jgi:hypothetical protein